VASPWGRPLIPQIDCNPVVDLTFVGRWIECNLANQVGQKVFQGFSTQRVPALSDAMQKTLDFDLGDVTKHRSSRILGLQTPNFRHQRIPRSFFRSIDINS